MTPDQLLTAVLTEIGWNLTKDYGWMNNANVFEVLHGCNTEDLLTSRDAVWEVLGLDKIEDGFLMCLLEVCGARDISYEQAKTDGIVYTRLLFKATCPQLLEAWLQFRQQQKGTK